VKNSIPSSFTPTVKVLTKVEHFQQLERRNKFLQVASDLFVNFFVSCGEIME
jgi:hypothetical protein